ncbi:MAG: hypothetical protein GX616_09400, partial [Planctomycetes bacterium]|nr:hypothetical protein [Planctomycetota bacterium]
MVYSAISVTRLLIELVALLAVGILLLGMLSRPRRRGTTPHCARCEYNLSGLTSNRCPECGTEMIPANIVYGEKIRRPWLAVTAVALAVIVMVLIGRWAWDYDWYRLRPTSWVISDVQSADAAIKSRAWRELDRRVRVGSLSAGQENRLIDVCLQEQTAKTPLTAMIDYLGPCLLDNRMSDSQRTLFFQQVMQFDLTARPVVIAGNPLPVRISERSRGPASSGLWVREYCSMGPDLDGGSYKGSRGAWSTSPMGNSGSRSGTQPLAPTLWDREISPGKHRLTLTVQLEVYSGRPEDMGEAGRLYKG